MSSADRFDADYFEHGVDKGISLYKDYHYMPERLKVEALAFIKYMGVERHQEILDFGCAKGFFVRALVELGYLAYGCDISEYALSQAGDDIGQCLWLLGNDIPVGWHHYFRWGFCKDVLEHCEYDEIASVVQLMAASAEEWLVIVPLGWRGKNEFVIPDYEKDKTHIIREDPLWWSDLFRDNGFEIMDWRYRVEGLKDKWFFVHPAGNIFLRLKRNS